eukprot:TRINITY_DN26561_c0_g1_i1.p1 TRINITY_DN26561_c0_g1~~TRINITY_DN26561_c0_g1_i1.p1  ORF type:complete len:1453 (+),score=222.18 TRINITY_DN26561_c0_g1_i1:115-4359(+)
MVPRPAAAAAALASLPCMVPAQLQLSQCAELPSAFRSSGMTQAQPRPCPEVRTVVHAGGANYLFACGNGVVGCNGDGSSGPSPAAPADCTSMGLMGCTSETFDLSFDSGRAGVYAACGDKVTYCVYDITNTPPMSACVDVSGAECPGTTAAGRGTIQGVLLIPPLYRTLVLSCKHTTSANLSGILFCKVNNTGVSIVASSCTAVGQNPCLQALGSGTNAAISLDSRGGLSVGCDDRGYTYCVSFSEMAGAGSCSAAHFGGSPCPGAYTRSITEISSGLTGVSCDGGGYQVCGFRPTAPPTASPARPTKAPAAVPTAAPRSPPTAIPTKHPIPPSARPSAVPSAGPSRQPRAPSVAPSVVPTERPSAAAAPAPPPPAPPPPPEPPTRGPSAAPGGGPTPRRAARHSCLLPAGSPPGAELRCMPAGPGGDFDWDNCSSVCPALSRVRPTSPPVPVPTVEPSPGSLAPTDRSCASLTCQPATSCRTASTCITVRPGYSFCAAGESTPDGATCDDGSPDTYDDRCKLGVCFGLPSGCALTDECREAHDPQCGTLLCKAGVCRRAVANEGRECDDRNPATARDVCRDGACVGDHLCLGVVCPEAEQCREPGVCNHTDGRCVQRWRQDATPCRAADVAVATDECVSGECASFATMRLSELAFHADGRAQVPVAAFSPGSQYRAVSSACRVVDNNPNTDFVDRRVARLPSSLAVNIGDGEFLLSSLGGDSRGDVVVIFSSPVALSSVTTTDSPGNYAQAPSQVDVSGCVVTSSAALDLVRAAAAAGCTEPTPRREHLLRLQDTLVPVTWATLNTSEPAPVPAAPRSRVFRLATSGAYTCYRVRPRALRGGCTTASGGILSGLMLGCCVRPNNDSEAPPLTGRSMEEVLRKCRDAYEPLAARWRRSKGTVLDEMVARAVVPPPGGQATALDRLRMLLQQDWRKDLSGSPLAELPAVVLVALRLYSQEPQDIDREMGWTDTPLPGPTTAGHGYTKAQVKDDALKDSWERYKEQHSCSGGARNESHYRMPNRASIELCRTHQWSSLDDYAGWVKYVAALNWACSVSDPASVEAAAGKGGNAVLTRVLGCLPAGVRQGYAALAPGDYFALPCLSSTSVADVADGEFMGDYPAFAVVLRLRFDAGHALGVDMRDLSMYPQEAEVLLPMFTVFHVTDVHRPRNLSSAVSLHPTDGWVARLRRALLHVRAAMRPLLVVEARCAGSLQRLDPEAARWLDEVAADAARAEAVLCSPSGGPSALALSPAPARSQPLVPPPQPTPGSPQRPRAGADGNGAPQRPRGDGQLNSPLAGRAPQWLPPLATRFPDGGTPSSFASLATPLLPHLPPASQGSLLSPQSLPAQQQQYSAFDSRSAQLAAERGRPAVSPALSRMQSSNTQSVLRRPSQQLLAAAPFAALHVRVPSGTTLL